MTQERLASRYLAILCKLGLLCIGVATTTRAIYTIIEERGQRERYEMAIVKTA